MRSIVPYDLELVRPTVAQLRGRMRRLATTALRDLASVSRSLPKFRGQGRLASAATSLLLSVGADQTLEVRLKAGHRLRLDCRVPLHRWILFSGVYDDAKCSTLLSFLRSGGAALDVGANIGLYAVPMALRVKRAGGRLFAVEPVPTNAEWLRYNLSLNGCSDAVDVLQLALSDRSGEAGIVLGTDERVAGAAVGNASMELYGPQFIRLPIKTERLDNIWPAARRLDIVKLDVEGHEAKFLEGAHETLARFRPVILMEVNRWYYEQTSVDFDSLIPSLLPRGYIFAVLRSGQVVQIDNLPQCTESDVLMMPAEAH